MTGAHLSSEDISRWTAGERADECARHLGECLLCRAEVARLESVLDAFGGAVREWGAAQPCGELPRAWQADRAARNWRMRRLRWSLAAACLVVLAAIPVWKNARDRRIAAEAARADAMLLEQVNRQVSRTAPAALEPLMNLVAWENFPAEAGAGVPRKKKGDER
jgi:hypothetical protein